ncbi:MULTISPECIES: response regulator [Cyanophyceae]|uniref:response regulator n=1 Tax=Cyanophyceae TaxID=3028117 RepID=UPI0002D2C878|nr:MULTISPECIES: response regulator [Cyanophyceae]
MTQTPNAPIYSACSLTAIQRSILMVDDQPGYLELMAEVVEEYFPELHLQTAPNGEQAWQFLNQGQALAPSAAENQSHWIYPSLIISDLNLPKISGVDLLHRIKQDPYLQAIPVIIFSTSQAEQDILRCYQAQANCFITKPSNVDDFFTVVQQIIAFWLNLVTLPHFPPQQIP